MNHFELKDFLSKLIIFDENELLDIINLLQYNFDPESLKITDKKIKSRFNNTETGISNSKSLSKQDARIYKYYLNRYTIFSKLQTNKSCCLYMTDELWYSVTPEDISLFIADYIYSCLLNSKKDLNKTIIIDCCCGGGGNTIQFAKKFPNCIGVDNNIEHLYCTYKNSELYNVQDRVLLKYGDWFKKEDDLLNLLNQTGNCVGCVFSSPPWGGPEYLLSEYYDLEKNLNGFGGGLTNILMSFKKFSKNIVLFLPKNSNLVQLSEITEKVFDKDTRCRIIYVKSNGYLKGLLCMWGEDIVF
ncbi:related to Trimethylguanosine synthase [Saccharomycodes ludwigii]|uniref:Trimethylguanosine synthase n=1 Tax=Saccharomycodes ludwigii TaxID=36035 RepID=A0A376B742_9ASCO|nr:hypothetical protein SCDLUD_002162 [Saccharomycodes ludwigii]KAH3902342.1 hypothetical protein SCDLUD_002162 [Saccharomycodes ludwigii]SSD60493.1 related to Trimethylguanosine synthase [Saccharomycodes ludwigii]